MSESTQNIVTPWDVQGTVDYEKIVALFGAETIDQKLIFDIEKRTRRRAHHFLRRGIFFAHRDLNQLLASTDDFFLYTGRGPSSNLHFGHLVPLLFTKYLQESFDAPLVFQMTDDEKFLFKSLSLDDTNQYAIDNAKDILALGFDVDRTFIFQNTRYVQRLYPNVLKIQRQVNANTMSKVFGFNEQDSIGKWAFPPMQIAPCFSSSFPGILSDKNMNCLIPCAIDQEPYFRLARSIASPLGFRKPSIIASKFFPSLQGVDSKMSSTSSMMHKQPSTIFINDTPKQIETVIKRFAFSGGKETVEKHRAEGANLDVDVSYQWLRFFMEDDDRLEQIGQDYKSGKLLTSEVKMILCKVLSDFAEQHAKKRAAITDEQLNFVMQERKID